MSYKNSWSSYNKGDCSVKHVGSVSYTEDDILIYTLYISPPLKKADESRLKDYFGQFGEVNSVNIVTRKNRSPNTKLRTFSFAFVCFKEAESASKALRCNAHYFSNRNMIVRSADSWKQPFQIKLRKTENELVDSICPNSNYSILNLNDDCLFLIFKYLTLDEQFKMATLCTRLEDIFKLFYKTTKSLNIDLGKSLTLMDFRQGLQKMGHQIEDITFSSGLSMKNFTRFIGCVSKFCPNICKLKLDSLHFKYNEIVHKISKKLLTIRHLELTNCSINDDMIKLLSNIKTIEYLDLTDNYDVTGLHLEKFENLTTLILNSCANIQPSFFIKMCSKTIKIRELNIRRCDRLNTSAIQALVENLNDLETLTICTCYQTNELERITQIKNLKHLTINQTNNKSETLFQKLAENKSKELMTLKITNFSHTDVKGNAIIEMIKLKQLDLPFANFCTDKFIRDCAKLQDLKILNIPGVVLSKDSLLNFLFKSPTIEFIDLSRRQDYDDDFVKQVIEVLKSQNRIRPLTLRVGFTNISSHIKEKSFVKENQHILKIDMNQTDYVMEMLEVGFNMLSDYDVDSDDSDIELLDAFGLENEIDDEDYIDDSDCDSDYMNAWDDLEFDEIDLLPYFSEVCKFLHHSSK